MITVDEVTPEVLRTIGSSIVGISKLSDDTLNALINQATLIAESDGMPEQVKVRDKIIPALNMATLNMALHLVTVLGKSAQGILSEKLDVMERHYADVSDRGWLNSSKWGQLYMWLYRKYGEGSTPRIAVIPH
ncbi:hypothetical protein [Lactobacillus crispatus]|uniref:hypothetical protein n=1 Tax=Lactobacillus crispatus TaxID=47770 RepID=UPI0022AC3481|nr:hypothetical protein [Lactobacillus crispatus]MCZ3846413.1 hypothetical protein [Lactobacillus crispatus]MCZ3848681.1 hypothetical protein [Lactobacillus crispatus]MCZ3854618.1 hypothetical protein [Lactobacillus crispatus]MCZ3856895.1 hypothetical protein [Lactobacillus crispatus]MCZ3859143.1 hypothetical protein [Lactobacillus crispatus]